jgi:hypothetical protein
MQPPTLLPMFDLRTRAVVQMERRAASSLLAEHRLAAVAPLSLDLIWLTWEALLPDPFAHMPTLRGPPIYFGPGPLWRRIIVIPPHVAQARFERKCRSAISPSRLMAWHRAVAEGWYRRHGAIPQHPVAAE